MPHYSAIVTKTTRGVLRFQADDPAKAELVVSNLADTFADVLEAQVRWVETTYDLAGAITEEVQ
jgi:hypothetical protein